MRHLQNSSVTKIRYSYWLIAIISVSAAWLFQQNKELHAQLTVRNLEFADLSREVDVLEASLNRIQTLRYEIQDILKAQQSKQTKDREFQKEIASFLVRYSESPEQIVAGSLTDRIRHMRQIGSRFDELVGNLSAILSHSPEYVRSIPSISPTSGWITSQYGSRRSPFTGSEVVHKGLDIGAEDGTKVLATADGEVLFSGYSTTFGNVVILQHGHGVITKYAHNSKLAVQKGQRVQRGQEIAIVGSTGRSTGVHVHYEVWVDGMAVDPQSYFLDSQEEAALLSRAQNPSGLLPIGGEEFEESTLGSSTLLTKVLNQSQPESDFETDFTEPVLVAKASNAISTVAITQVIGYCLLTLGLFFLVSVLLFSGKESANYALNE